MLNARLTTSRVLIVLGALLSCADLPSQVILSTIRGTAGDPTGAVIANAEVTLVHLETNAKRTTTTNQNGDFELAGLDPAVVESVILQTGEVHTPNVTLQVGAVDTELTLTAGAAVIAAETAMVEAARWRFGNSGVNILEGPGNQLNNLSLAKTFSVTECLKFTLTAAAEDAFNHPNFNFSSVAANISSPANVGKISSLSWSGGSRVIELRGRIDF